MSLWDQAALIAFNRALAVVIAELVESLENQGLERQEAVALAATWSSTYLRLVHEQHNEGTGPQGT